MDQQSHPSWEIGLSDRHLDVLLSGRHAGKTLWFLAGYVRGLADSQSLHLPARAAARTERSAAQDG